MAFPRRTLLRAARAASICLAVLPATVSAQAEVHERAIADAYSAWVGTVNAKDLEAWKNYLAPDAIFFPPDNPVLSDRDEIIEFYAQLFEDDQFHLDCRQVGVEVSEAEDMAWAHGYCESTGTDPDGGLAHAETKWVKVWKRQPSGDWKCAMNHWSSVGNSDPGVPEAAAPRPDGAS